MRTVGTGDHRRLSTTGKPMRALRALRNTDPMNPMYEADVWEAARRDSQDTDPWHAPLATLVFHDLAIRTGTRGGFQWYITKAGKDLLEKVNQS